MKKLSVLLLSFTTAAAARADDATQFRGTGGLGISSEKNLPITWSKTEGLRWKAELPGRGLSNPVIAGGRVYVTATAAYQQKREAVLCFDVKTGKKLWERQVWATGTTLCHPKTNMAAPTPITDGERVYALFATGDLVCYDAAGDLVWYRSMVGDYPTIGNNVGAAASPTIWNDLVLLGMENAGESFAAGIDKLTGENRWRVERPRGINWATPLVIRNSGDPEVVFHSGKGVDAYDPASGKKKWSAPGLRNAGYSTLTTADGVLYFNSEKFTALRIPKKDAEPEVLWQSIKLKPGYCSPIAHQGRVYVLHGNGVASCADAKTGDILWTHRSEGTFTASPLLADGKLYYVNEAGVTTVLDVSGKEPKVVGTNAIEDTILASPVAADGAIFLRSDGALYCIGKK